MIAPNMAKQIVALQVPCGCTVSAVGWWCAHMHMHMHMHMHASPLNKMDGNQCNTLQAGLEDMAKAYPGAFEGYTLKVRIS